MNPIEFGGRVPPLGLTDGLGDDGLGDDGLGDVGCDGDGWVAPLQATPLRAKSLGAGLLLLFHVPLKPKLTVALVAMLPFHAALRAVTCAPDWVMTEFQCSLTC